MTIASCQAVETFRFGQRNNLFGYCSTFPLCSAMWNTLELEIRRMSNLNSVTSRRACLRDLSISVISGQLTVALYRVYASHMISTESAERRSDFVWRSVDLATAFRCGILTTRARGRWVSSAYTHHEAVDKKNFRCVLIKYSSLGSACTQLHSCKSSVNTQLVR